MGTISSNNEDINDEFQNACLQRKNADQLEANAKDLEDTVSMLSEHLVGIPDEDEDNARIYAQMITDHLEEKKKLVSTV